MLMARPKAIPASHRYGRPHEVGPQLGFVPAVRRASTHAIKRARAVTRSRVISQNASRVNRAMKLSRMLTRLSTMACPSIASSKPAIVARVTEPNRRWATSIMSPTSKMPAIATPMRQPKALSGPKAAMPAPMIHLPS